VGNAFDNDLLNGAPVVLADITATVLTPATPINGAPVPVLDPMTGIVSVPAGTPAGTYTITYQICENLNPATATMQ
jgi:large repetitive protein